MTPVITLQTDAGIKQCKLADLDGVFKAQNFLWGGTQWAEACVALRNSILEAIRGHLNTDVYLHQLRQHFKAPFQASNGSQLKLKRFQTVHSLLDNELLPSTVKQTLSRRMTNMEDMVDALFGRHFNLFTKGDIDKFNNELHDEFEVLQCSIEAYTMHQMLAQMSSLANHDSIPADFQLTEDAKTASARAGLEDRVEKLKAARQTINELAGVPAWRHHDGSTGSYIKAVTAASLGGSGLDAGSTINGSYCFVWPDEAPAVLRAACAAEPT